MASREGIGDVLDEEHDQDVVLILAGVDGAAKRIAGFPQYSVDLVLVDFAGHKLDIDCSVVVCSLL